MEIFQRLRIPLLIDSYDENFLRTLPQLAMKYREIKFILLGFGFRVNRYIEPLLKKLENVYFEASFFVETPMVEEYVLKYGSEKLLFGSSMPLKEPSGGLGLIFYARIGDKDKENILNNNWIRLEEGIAYDT